MVKKMFFLGSIQKDLVYSWQPFLYHNKEKFCQTYEISKEWGCLIADTASPKHLNLMSITREGGREGSK